MISNVKLEIKCQKCWKLVKIVSSFRQEDLYFFLSLSLSLSIILNVITQHYNKQIAIAARGIRRDVNNISSDRD